MQNSNAQTRAAYTRLTALFDEGSFVELGGLVKTGEEDAGVITGWGYVDGAPVYAFSQDHAIADGALGRVHAAKIKKIYETAAKTGCPVVSFYDSDGVRVDEGNTALAAYGELLAASNNLSGVVPQIAVVTGVCAGCSAMLACSADVLVMSESGALFMTAPFTSKAAGDDTAGAGSAQNAAASGVAQLVCKTEADAVQKARELLLKLPANNLSAPPICEYEESGTAASDASDVETNVAAIADADSLLELSPAFGTAYTALGGVQGATVGFVAPRGTLTAADSVKIARFVRTCDAYSIPIVTLVHATGFAGTAKDELAGSIRDAAKLAHAYAEATAPKISLITGMAIGAANVALAGKGANADLVLAWQGAVLSPLSPETAVEFFRHDELKGADDLAAARQRLAAAYAENEASAIRAAQDGIVDDVIEPAQSRQAIISGLDMLSGKRVRTLPKKHGNMPL